MDYRSDDADSHHMLTDFLSTIVKELDFITEEKSLKYRYNFARSSSENESGFSGVSRHTHIFSGEVENWDTAGGLPFARLN